MQKKLFLASTFFVAHLFGGTIATRQDVLAHQFAGAIVNSTQHDAVTITSYAHSNKQSESLHTASVFQKNNDRNGRWHAKSLSSGTVFGNNVSPINMRITNNSTQAITVVGDPAQAHEWGHDTQRVFKEFRNVGVGVLGLLGSSLGLIPWGVGIDSNDGWLTVSGLMVIAAGLATAIYGFDKRSIADDSVYADQQVGNGSPEKILNGKLVVHLAPRLWNGSPLVIEPGQTVEKLLVVDAQLYKRSINLLVNNQQGQLLGNHTIEVPGTSLAQFAY